MPVVEFFVTYLHQHQLSLVGLVALLSLALQKASGGLIKGTLKTIVSSLVLSAGAGFLQTGFPPCL